MRGFSLVSKGCQGKAGDWCTPSKMEKKGNMGRKVMGEFIKGDGAHGLHSWNEKRGFYNE